MVALAVGGCCGLLLAAAALAVAIDRVMAMVAMLAAIYYQEKWYFVLLVNINRMAILRRN
jgi:hypothetical protein